MTCIPREIQPIPKENLRIHFDFGGHANRKDASTLKKTLQKIKPDVYVMEAALMAHDERLELITRLNAMAKEPKGGAGRKKLLREIADDHSILTHREFKLLELASVLASRAVFYAVEEADEEAQRGDYFILPWLMCGNSGALESLRSGHLDEAMLRAEKSFRDLMDLIVVKRDPLIADGFERMRFELPLMFPELSPERPLTILARYGSAHGAVAGLLAGRGYMVQSDFSSMGITEELSMALSMDPGIVFSAEQRAKILFLDLYQRACPGLEGSVSEDSCRMGAIYGKLGAGGFIALLRSLSDARFDEAGQLAALRQAFSGL